MGHLDVLVLPSYAEPFGTVLAEAMAAGTPVVATARRRAARGRRRTASTGALVRARAPRRARRRRCCGCSPTASEMGAGARGARARSFDADAYADRVEALIAA